MADAVVSVLLDNLLSILVTEGRQLVKFDDQFEETTDELQFMQSYLKEADQVKRRDRNEILKRVMSNLRELVYDAEDVIADCQLLFQKKHEGCAPNFTSYCFPTHLKSRHQLGKRLRNINQGVRKVKKHMESYLQTAPRQPRKDEDGGNMQMTYPTLIDEDEMVGLEDDSTKIINWILEADGPSTVIGIAGMGGIGKTTLAQKIYDSAKDSFKHSLFVTVSQSFKLDELLKKMLGKLKVDERFMRENDVRDLLERLKAKLDDKYSIVLDDVWKTDKSGWWESLKSALPKVSGSYVIVTTRNEEVAKYMGTINHRIHRPQILSDEYSWSLFSKVAFARNGGKCTKPDLVDVGMEIVAKCKGLPLAIKVVGGMMARKGDSIHEWRQISERLKEELEISKTDEPLISCLELSYEELPTHLKPCFLCFAMFPEDFEIDVEDMVNWWIGEGFVWGKNGKTAVEIGEECISELCNRFLILGVDKDMFERSYVSCKMHDMVRDMVIRIAREERFFVRLDCGGSPAFSEQSRHLGIVGNTAVESIGNSSTKLRTLVGIGIQSKEMIASLEAKLCKVRWLRVLSLSLSDSYLDGDVVCSDWLSGIGSLQHLVYLNIQSSSALISLPDSIGNLRNLRILCLRYCPNLKRPPVSITTLEKLTTILIFKPHSLECMPEGVGKLSNLERLGWFSPVNKNGSGISELKSLTKLRELRMEIKSVEEIEEGEWNVLSMLQHLQILRLDFGGISVERDGVVNKIEGELSPLKSLRELYLWEWPGERTPAWLSPTSLPNLQFLWINGERIREMGQRFWDSESGVWKVEVLVLSWLEEMEEEWQRMRRAMPSLRLLKVRNCRKLKSFPFDVTSRWKWKKWRREEEDSVAGGAKEEEKEGTSLGEITAA